MTTTMTGIHGEVVRAAKRCVTAAAWFGFSLTYGEYISKTSESKVVEEIWQILKADDSSVHYDQALWTALLKGCLSSWDLILGMQIARFILRIPSINLGLLATEILLEGGEPAEARKLAQRCWRLTGLEPWHKLYLRMVICNSYVEEGKSTLAARYLSQMVVEFQPEQLSQRNLADIRISMGRAQFFLGHYLQAAENFCLAYTCFEGLQRWESAAKAIFNAGASFHNSGPQHREHAFSLIADCKKLAEEHQLNGPLSHCYAFHGTDEYQHGHFRLAARNYKKALLLCPTTETSFRRLHITSMLALTHIRLNQIQVARKYGDMTQELAEKDHSERFQARYATLKSEILWQDGKLPESQEVLSQSTNSLHTGGIHTLEELSAFSRLILQGALLRKTIPPPSPSSIALELHHNSTAWLEFLNACSHSELTLGHYGEALKLSQECYRRAEHSTAHYYRALALSVMIQVKLAQSIIDAECIELLGRLDALAQDLMDTDIPLDVAIFRAALAYRQQRFDEIEGYLRSAYTIKFMGRPARIVLGCWLSTLRGHSARLLDTSHQYLVARTTRVCFAPTVCILSETYFRVSDLYEVNLDRHPIIAKIISYLLSRPEYQCSPQELHYHVWNESQSIQGWEQKIRNSIMRIRQLFPYTIAPLIIYSDHQIRLNSDAIRFFYQDPDAIDLDEEVLMLLREGPLSTLQLSNRIHKSRATIKRSISKLTAKKKIFPHRQGRKIMYTCRSL